MFKSTKEYGHEQGLSCCFRQWRATHSHCSLLHGYAIAVKLTFCAKTLDDRNWVQDFGGLGKIKQYLKDTFDHKTLVASDDPQIEEISALAGLGIADVIVVENVGCEAFALMIYNAVHRLMPELGEWDSRVYLESVEVKEHNGNSAIYSIYSF